MCIYKILLKFTFTQNKISLTRKRSLLLEFFSLKKQFGAWRIMRQDEDTRIVTTL